MHPSKTEKYVFLVLIGGMYLYVLYAIVCSVRQGKIIIILQGQGTSREKNPLLFWFHIVSAATVSTLVTSLILYALFKENT